MFCLPGSRCRPIERPASPAKSCAGWLRGPGRWSPMAVSRASYSAARLFDNNYPVQGCSPRNIAARNACPFITFSSAVSPLTCFCKGAQKGVIECLACKERVTMSAKASTFKETTSSVLSAARKTRV